MFLGDEQLAALLDRVSAAFSDPSALPDTVMAARIPHFRDIPRPQAPSSYPPGTTRSWTISQSAGDAPVMIPSKTETKRPKSGWTIGGITSVPRSSPPWLPTLEHATLSSPWQSAPDPIQASPTAAARYRLEPERQPSSRRGTDRSRTPEALSSWDTDPVERGDPRHRGSHLEDRSRKYCLALVRFLKEARRKTVVFTSFTMTAQHVREALAGEFGPQAVAAHLADRGSCCSGRGGRPVP